MLGNIVSVVVLIWFVVPSLGHARNIYFGSKTESIQIPYGGTYLFRFPSEVRTITGARKFTIKPADKNQPNYAVLTVEPKISSGTNRVAFILSDGTIVTTKLTIGVNGLSDKLDEVVDFRSDENEPGVEVERQTANPSELELMKAMIRGERAPGYVLKDISKEISPGFKGVKTRLVRKYTGGRYAGFIFELSNSSRDQTLSINIKNLSLGDPNLAVLSNVNKETLEPKSTALLRIVAKATSAYNQLILPIESVERK